MTSCLITIEVVLQDSALELERVIEAELQKQGEPIHWAVTEVDCQRQRVLVGALLWLKPELS
ncbi:hypothetical protein H6F90_13290 [Trichocoleus sp. FACHB-591]|uniref:hypothetical protein n=1 Tax=Trichocoleus TaxID=450526 RepID=UPI00168964EF|nr:hypothetical protein [Trichocoleus sp. FACHB-591]MBD2096116.1 hypothetical protein [Trichocoleus sp. FACHB-591]